MPKYFEIPIVPDEFPNRFVLVQKTLPVRAVDTRPRYRFKGEAVRPGKVAELLVDWDTYVVWLNPAIRIDTELTRVLYRETPEKDGVEVSRYVCCFYEQGPISMELGFDRFGNESAIICEPGSRYEISSWVEAPSMFASIRRNYSNEREAV